MSILEVLAAVCGLWAVRLMIIRSLWSWPIGLVQVLLYTKVFYDARLYSQTLLQIVFALLQIQGWWQWHQSLKVQRAGHQSLAQEPTVTVPGRIVVERLTSGQRIATVLVTIGVSAVLGWLMQHYTDASWPMADATITGLSLVAQWLLINRRVENWVLWILVDVLSILVFSAQGLWPTVVLYMAFLVMAMHGLATWWEQLK